MNNENKEAKLTNIDVNDTKIKQLQDEEFATKTELNIEASTRASTDRWIIDNFKALNVEEIEQLENKVKTNDERITILEEGIWDKIDRLEKENKELNSKLDEANTTIGEKDDEIKKLRDELAGEDENEIRLKFANPPEFVLIEILSVKNFILRYLKDLVISKMELRYPDAVFGQDYTILLDGLDYADVMQGNIVPVIVQALENSKLVGESIFEIKVTYDYDISQQARFVEEFLLPAIPSSLRNISDTASPDYNVPNELMKIRPLKLLLNNKDFKYLTFKVFAEMNAGSYWSDLHRKWQFIRNGYSGTGESTIGIPKVINNISDLFNTTGYYDNIFKIIEKRINDSGVPCTITKDWARSSQSDKLLHTLGNLIFDVRNSNLNNSEIVITQSRDYYVTVNFQIVINNDTKKFYRSVTLFLTDNLELY